MVAFLALIRGQCRGHSFTNLSKWKCFTRSFQTCCTRPLGRSMPLLFAWQPCVHSMSSLFYHVINILANPATWLSNYIKICLIMALEAQVTPLHSPQQPRPLHGHCAVWRCRPLSLSTNWMGFKSAHREGFTKQKTPLELILNSPNGIALSMYFTSFCPPMTSEHGLTQYKIWFINLTLFLEHPAIVKDSYLKLDV